MLSASAFKRIGRKSLKMFKDIIFSKQKDVKGNKFKRYSKKYAQRKKAGDLPLQRAETKTSRAPFVSGNFKNDFRFREATKDGFRLGWAGWGHLVGHLQKMGRPVTTESDAFPEPVKDMIDNSLNSEIKLVLKKKHRNKTITIGK